MESIYENIFLNGINLMENFDSVKWNWFHKHKSVKDYSTISYKNFI